MGSATVGHRQCCGRTWVVQQSAIGSGCGSNMGSATVSHRQRLWVEHGLSCYRTWRHRECGLWSATGIAAVGNR